MVYNYHPMSKHIALQKWQPFLETYSLRELKCKIELLKAVCDDTSVAEIDCYITRILSHPPLEFREQINIAYRAIAENTRSKWAQEEVKSRPKTDPTALKKEYDLDKIDISDNFIRPESFFYHSGLTFVKNAEKIIAGRASIDGGAYRGESAVVLRKNYPSSEVHAFEPNEKNYEILEHTSLRTRYGTGIIPVNKGLASFTNRVKSRFSGHGTMLNDVVDLTGDIEVVSIDDYVSSQKIFLGFLKLDVEGLETAVVKGALETIRRDRPILSIAVYHSPEDFLELAPFIHNLKLNYNLMIRHLHPQLTSFFGEFMLICHPKE